MMGKPAAEVEAELRKAGLSDEQVAFLTPHKVSAWPSPRLASSLRVARARAEELRVSRAPACACARLWSLVLSSVLTSQLLAASLDLSICLSI
jgi:hypothetical protein